MDRTSLAISSAAVPQKTSESPSQPVLPLLPSPPAPRIIAKTAETLDEIITGTPCSGLWRAPRRPAGALDTGGSLVVQAGSPMITAFLQEPTD